MKRFYLVCVAALSLAAGSARAADPGPGSPVAEEAAPNNSITLESGSIDLFVDVLVVNDIGGRVDGVYDDANAALLSAISNDAKAILAKNVVFADAKLSNGMLLNDDHTLVYAKAGKATERKFDGHVAEGSLPSLVPKESMVLFRSVLDDPSIALTHSAFSGKDRGNRHPASFPVTIPPSGLGGSSRYLLFVQASARHIPFGKTFAIGVATGLASGGTYQMMLMSGGSVNVALIDKQSSKVLWVMQRPLRDFNQIQIVSIKLLQSLNRAISSNSPVVADNISQKAPDLDATAAVPGHNSVRDAKLALRAGAISRAEYDSIVSILQGRHRQKVEDLRQMLQSGEISDAAFEILSMKSELEYTGASSG